MDLCAGLVCPDYAVCREGVCVQDPCDQVYCASGESCRDGDCIPDPCAHINCPPDTACQDGFCVYPPGHADGGPEEPGPDGDGGVEPDGDPGGDPTADAGADGGEPYLAQPDSCGCAAQVAPDGPGDDLRWAFLLLLLAGLRRLTRNCLSG